MRLMYDAVNPARIPPGADIVAGYVDGRYAWPTAAWRAWPDAVLVRIAVNPATVGADVLDVEPGNWPATDAPAWARAVRARGREPVVYCSPTAVAGFSQADVLAAFAAVGEPAPGFWLAMPGVKSCPPGCVAVQSAYYNEYDLSLVPGSWPDWEAGMETDDQLRKQIQLLSDALYDLTRVLTELSATLQSSNNSVLVDARTKVNALNPTVYTFPTA